MARKVSANLKVRTSATAHTRNVMGNRKTAPKNSPTNPKLLQYDIFSHIDFFVRK
jgi:hypothetical protein